LRRRPFPWRKKEEEQQQQQAMMLASSTSIRGKQEILLLSHCVSRHYETFLTSLERIFLSFLMNV
jgi:hypothetical protein